MEIDSSFEFDCPKWCDFELDSNDPGESLNDSWFKRDHPLHEPKDKAKHDEELRPLITRNDTIINQDKKKSTSPKNTTKFKRAEKSLGLKRSIRSKRGSTGRRKLPEINKAIVQQLGENVNQEQVSSHVHGDQKLPKDDFNCKQNFTPPANIMSPTRGEKTPSMLDSPMRGPPLTTTSGPKRRRKLPSIPSEFQNLQLPSSPLQLNSTSQETIPTHSSKHVDKKPTPTAKDHKLTSDKSVEELLELHNQKILASKSKYDKNGRRILQPKSSTLSSKVSETTSKRTDSKQNDSDLREKDKLPVEETAKSNHCSAHNKTFEIESEEISLKNLLKLHNEKVSASKCKYDSNGRRIQPADPAFCPAPTKSDVTKSPKGRSKQRTPLIAANKRPSSSNDSDSRLMSKAKHFSQSVERERDTNSKMLHPQTDKNNTIESASKKLSHESEPSSSTHKRPISQMEAKSTQKSKRRSCAAAPTTSCLSLHGKLNRIESESDKISNRHEPKALSSTLKRSISQSDVKSSLKGKRRSCVAAPATSCSKTTIIQKPHKQKRRSCFADVNDETDQELKNLIARHNERLAMLK